MAWPEDTRLKWFARDYPLAAGWLGTCLLAWLVQPVALEYGPVVRERLWDLELWRLLTPAFVHVDGWHLAGNLLLILLLVPRLEDRLGRRHALHLLVLATLGAASGAALGHGERATGASGPLLGGLAALMASAYHRTGSWRASWHDAEGYAAIVGAIGVTGVALLNPDTDMHGHAGGMIVGGVLGDLWLQPRRPPAVRRLLGRLLSIALAISTAATVVAPWNPDWHLHQAAGAPDAATRGELLRQGLAACEGDPDLLHALWLHERETAPARALAYRLEAIEAGRVDPSRHSEVARLEVALEFAGPLEDLERARRVLARVDPSWFRAAEAYAGLDLLARADEQDRLRRWAVLLMPRHGATGLGHLCRALLGADEAAARDAARRWLESRPPDTPPGLVRWVEGRFGE